MTQEEIINGSKLIAEYLGWIYVPFSAELKEKGMKAGWYKTIIAEPQVEKVKVGGDREIIVDINVFKYNIKNGWKLFEGRYYKFICRKHLELRFYNSWDSLMLVVNKILNTQFEDTEYYRFRTFGLRCEETNEFMVRFERFQLFKSSSLLETTFKAVIQIIKTNE